MKLSFFSSSKILVGLLIGVVLFGALLAPKLASAQSQTTTATASMDDCGMFSGNLIKCAVHSLAETVRGFLGWLIGLIAEGIGWLIRYNSTIMTLPAVRAGFTVCLSVVNVMFVMALIIMAFQMILGFGGHETKSLLTKIIVSALLVNFSFLIAGFLLDVSNVFTNFFLGPVQGGNFANALGLNKIGCIGSGAVDAMGHCAASLNNLSTLEAILYELFSVFMTGLILIVVIAVFGTIVVRTVTVAGLLMVMPLVWGLRVFPGLHEHSSQWWSKFMNWGVTMLPTMTFFLWLAVQTTNKLNFNSPKLPSFDATAGAGGLQNVFSIGIQIILIGGIMIFGLKAAQHAGAISASATLAAGKKALGFGAKAASFGATVTGVRWGARRLGVNNLPQTLSGKFADYAAGNRFMRAVVPTAAIAGAQHYSHTRSHELEEEGKKLAADLSAEQLANLAAGEIGIFGTDDSRVKYFNALKAKGKDGFKAMLKREKGAAELQSLAKAYASAEHITDDNHDPDLKALTKKVGDLGAVLKNKPAAAVAFGVAKNLSEAYRKIDGDFDFDDIVAGKTPAGEADFINSIVANQAAAIARQNGEKEIKMRAMIARTFADQVGGSAKAAIAGLAKDLEDEMAKDEPKSAEIARLSAAIANNVRAVAATDVSAVAKATAAKMKNLDKIGSLAATAATP